MIDPKELQTGRTLAEILPCHVWRYRQVALALDQAPPGPKILDLFCGNGYGTSILAEQLSPMLVIGADRNPEALAIAEGCYRFPNSSFVPITWPGETQEVFDERPFDAIVCLESIEHVEDDLAFARFLESLLGPDGLLVVSCPNAKALDVRNFPYHFRHYTFSQLRSLLKEAGFRVLQVVGQVGERMWACPENELTVHHFIAVAMRQCDRPFARLRSKGG